MAKPKTESELAALIKSASGPFSIRGGGSRGMAPQVGEVLETSALTGIKLYEPGGLTLVAAAGTPLAEINATLAEKNQRLAFEPAPTQYRRWAVWPPAMPQDPAEFRSAPPAITCWGCGL